MGNGKPWYQSTTIWFNVATGALEVVQYLSGAGIIPPGIGTIAVNVGNILLRVYKTSQPIGSPEPPQ